MSMICHTSSVRAFLTTRASATAFGRTDARTVAFFFLPLGQTQEPLEQTFPPEQLTPLQGSFETAVHPELALPS